MRLLSACVLLVFAAVAAAGCNPFQPKACTAIGCTDGLIVEVTGAPTGAPVTVTAIAPDGSSKTAPCRSAGTACTARLDEFMPAKATLRVSWDFGTAEFQISPTYVTTYPNGRDCGGACVQAHVTVTVSA